MSKTELTDQEKDKEKEQEKEKDKEKDKMPFVLEGSLKVQGQKKMTLGRHRSRKLW